MTIVDGELASDVVPDPEPGPGEVLIEVAAAGVNRADLLQVAGHYPPPFGAPAWPGLEVSGTIAATGGDTGFSTGDEVVALLPGGGYAELVAVDAGLVLHRPEGVDLIDAAGLIEAAATVDSNLGYLFDREKTEPPRVLIHGAAGGIGTFAVQYADRLVGAEVWATARDEYADQLIDLGAEHVIDYRTEDFAVRLQAVDGADAILDVVGAAYLDDNLKALASDGWLVVIGLQKGRKAELDLGRLLARRQTITGNTLRGRPIEQLRRIVSEVGERVWLAVEADRIAPVVTTRLPLSEAEEAHHLMAAGGRFGKIVLTVA
jgi:putative PIG3 family NAD(P)H quinone oxidoreductase